MQDGGWIAQATENGGKLSDGTRQVSKWVPYKIFVGLSAVALLVASAVLLRESGEENRAAERQGVITIAVLPFQLVRVGGGDSGLGLGIASELIARMSNHKSVSVRPLSAVRRYAGSAQDPMQIGRDLRVEYVLGGTIQNEGGRVRIAARLVCVACGGGARWEGRFEDDSGEISRVEDSIAERVLEAAGRK